MVFAVFTAVQAQSLYVPKLTQSDFDNYQIGTQNAVGTTVGRYSVSLSGTANYSIPIEMPLGTDGMVPKLSLVYDSQGGSTYFGQGWSLMGLSHITRTNKDHYRDGWAKSPELETLSDAFALDGAQLILVSGSYGKNASTYRTESETFSKIILHEDLNSSGSWFEVVARTGVITHYAAGYKLVGGAYIPNLVYF